MYKLLEDISLKSFSDVVNILHYVQKTEEKQKHAGVKHNFVQILKSVCKNQH